MAVLSEILLEAFLYHVNEAASQNYIGRPLKANNTSVNQPIEDILVQYSEDATWIKP